MKAKINVLNHDLERWGMVDEYQSFSFIRHYNDVGDFTIVINSASRQAHLLSRGAFIIVENDANKFGIINHKTSKEEEDGTSTFTYKGKTLGLILNWRDIIPSQNEVHDKVQDNIESILYHYVDNHCINPSDSNRRFPMLRAARNQKRWQTVQWTTTRGKVLGTIKTISTIYDVGWRINADIDNQEWLFEVYEGKDLSINQNINSPVIFSKNYENVSEMIYIEDEADERNFAYVLSDGKGADRKLYETEIVKGFDRKEITFEINSRDEDDSYIDVPDLATKKLEEYFVVKNLEARIYDCDMFQYERDFNLGDIVTVQNPDWNVSDDLRIITIEETYGESGLQLYATFGKKIPSLLEKIKRESKIYEINK